MMCLLINVLVDNIYGFINNILVLRVILFKHVEVLYNNILYGCRVHVFDI